MSILRVGELNERILLEKRAFELIRSQADKFFQERVFTLNWEPQWTSINT